MIYSISLSSWWVVEQPGFMPNCSFGTSLLTKSCFISLQYLLVNFPQAPKKTNLISVLRKFRIFLFLRTVLSFQITEKFCNLSAQLYIATKWLISDMAVFLIILLITLLWPGALRMLEVWWYFLLCCQRLVQHWYWIYCYKKIVPFSWFVCDYSRNHNWHLLD